MITLKKSLILRVVTFYKCQSGVYGIMMAVMSFVLIGIIALAVDGSGILLDKARFVQGMEQAGLALVTENNQNRNANNSHSDVSRQSVTKKDEQQFGTKLAAQQDKRNQEIIRGLVRSYYLPNTYLANGEDAITDRYQYYCARVRNNKGELLKSVACELSGDFDRPSWIYLGKNKGFSLTFAETVNIDSGSVFVQKEIGEKYPIDIMLVTDLTGSMDEYINGLKKITSLRNVVGSISNTILNSPDQSPYNRMGFVAFSFGAQQEDKNKCYLPYVIRRDNSSLFWRYMNYRVERSMYTDHMVKYIKEFNQLVDYSASINQIDLFTGNYINSYPSFDKDGRCLSKNKSKDTTSFWYGKDEANVLTNKFRQLEAGGTTLASSGLLIGANLLMNKNQDIRTSPSQLNTNTKRLLIILSDGLDGINPDIEKRNNVKLMVTNNLLNLGACDRIRQRIDSLQDNKYPKQDTVIAFVAFGYQLSSADRDSYNAWIKCVKQENYYEAKNEAELLETFQNILGINEEVGRSLNQRPNF